MANKMMTKGKPAKKSMPKFEAKSGPNMMPHTGKAGCRCPNCKDKMKK